MLGRRNFGLIFCVFFAAVTCVLSRKQYEIHEESLKLFKEDLETVLLRFRFTTQYHKILMEKVNEYKKGFLRDTKAQIKRYMLKRLEHRAKEMVSKKEDETMLTTITVPEHEQDNLQFEDTFVRKNLTPVERLDSYHQINTLLSVAQKNIMKELGFQYAGRYVDELIKHVKGNLRGLPDWKPRTTKRIVWVNKYGEPETISAEINADTGLSDKNATIKDSGVTPTSHRDENSTTPVFRAHWNLAVHDWTASHNMAQPQLNHKIAAVTAVTVQSNVSVGRKLATNDSLINLLVVTEKR